MKDFTNKGLEKVLLGVDDAIEWIATHIANSHNWGQERHEAEAFRGFLNTIPKQEWNNYAVSGIKLPRQEFMLQRPGATYSSLQPEPVVPIEAMNNLNMYGHENFIISTVGLTPDLVHAYGEKLNHDGVVSPYARAITNLGFGEFDYNKVHAGVQKIVDMRGTSPKLKPPTHGVIGPAFGLKYMEGDHHVPANTFGNNIMHIAAGPSNAVAIADHQIVPHPGWRISPDEEVLKFYTAKTPQGHHEWVMSLLPEYGRGR